MAENPHLLANEIHGTFGTGLTGTNFPTRITGLVNDFPTGNVRNDYLYKRVLREYYRNLDNHGFTGFQTDAVDAGFTPLTITGFFDTEVNVLLGVDPVTLFFDLFPGALGAYSLRKLNPNYSGPAAKIRRTSDNAEADVAFDSNGEVSENSVATITNFPISPTTLGLFIDTDPVKVVKLYDQSLNNNHFTQPTNSRQPRIAEGGNLVTSNGKLGIKFISADSTSLAMPEDSLVGLSSLSYFMAFNPTSDIDSIFSAASSFSSYILDIYLFRSDEYTYGIDAGEVFAEVPPPPFDQTTLHSFLVNSAGSALYIDGQERATFDGSTSFLQTAGLSPTLGAFHGGNGGYSSFILSEFILYNSDQGVNLSGIQENINSNYSIYS